nr:helix-turn-helix domain-containing protein [Thermodesulfovibrio sp. N1]
MKNVHGKKQKLQKKLGISRKALWEKLKTYGVDDNGGGGI